MGRGGAMPMVDAAKELEGWLFENPCRCRFEGTIEDAAVKLRGKIGLQVRAFPKVLA